MKRMLRTAALPPAMALWPRIRPRVAVDGRDTYEGGGRAPVEAAEFGHLGNQGARGDRADPRHALEQVVGGAPSRGAADGVADVAVEVGELGLEHLERGGDGACHLRRAGLPPAVLLHADHLDDLAAAGDELGEGLRVRVRHRPRLGPHALGEEGDRLGVEAVGLGEPPGGAGEVADLARVDDGERQAGAGQRRGDGDFETAGGLQHHEGGRQGPQLRGQAVEAGAVARNGERLARRAEMHVEAVLRHVDAGEDRHLRRLIHDPSLRMRARGLAAAAAQATVRVPGQGSRRGPLL